MTIFMITQDSFVITNYFPNALTGVTHLFKAKSGNRLVLPEHLVFREELANTRTPPAQDVDLSDPAAAAREEEMTEQQFMAEQKRALKAAENAKRKEGRKNAAKEKARKEKRENTSNPELREVKDALALDENINLSAQQEALKAFEEAKENAQRGKDLASTNAKQHEQGRESQKQHSWHPGSDPMCDTMPVRSPRPLPRHNEKAAVNILTEHERAHQQQGEPGNYPQSYSQSPKDQQYHRGTDQTYDSRYPPHHGNTRPEEQPQRDMRRMNGHIQMTPQNFEDPDYENFEVYHTKSQRNDQSNQPPQENVNPQQPGAHYQNMGETYQYQETQSGQEFVRNPNEIHPPPNNQAHRHQAHHDTHGGGAHQPNTPPQVPQDCNASVGSSNPYNLAVGSTVQVASVDPNDPPHYGVIRWTGRVAGVDGQVAGIELVSFIIILITILI